MRDDERRRNGVTTMTGERAPDAAPANASYVDRRERLRHYFDRTAADTWANLTSDAPVSRIRRTVRAGRDEMRGAILERMPEDLQGLRVLDAGCGTGGLCIEAARRGASVVGIDVSPTLVDIARERTPAELRERIRYEAGDMLATGGEPFDRIVAMDSVIHYEPEDLVAAVGALLGRLRDVDARLLFTFAPSTLPLEAMNAIGKLFPRGDRSPRIEPIRESMLSLMIGRRDATRDARILGTRAVSSGFYKSTLMELAPR